MTALSNTTLPTLRALSRLTFVRASAERALARSYFDRLKVRVSALDALAAGLSGGTQQKLVLAKWLAAKCRILILDEPTRGVDVGAKAEIHALIDELASSGSAVLLISSELPEVLHLSTRIIVLRDGRVAGEPCFCRAVRARRWHPDARLRPPWRRVQALVPAPAPAASTSSCGVASWC